MTSSDLLDTALALQCKQSGEIILDKLNSFHLILRKLAIKYKDTFQIGRSHGVHAEPITFGLKLALWSEEIKRHITRFKNAIEDIKYGQISGAVWTYQHLDPSVEVRTCKKLGLYASSVSLVDPKEIIAKGSSVDGLITSKSFGFEGETHLPFI